MGDKSFFDTKPSMNFWVIMLLFLVIAVSPMLDIFVSNLFYKDGFYLKENVLFRFVQNGIPEILLFICFLFCFLWLVGHINGKKGVLKINTPKAILVGGSMLLGPILIVNGMLKMFWDRARPINIIQFGGDKEFSPAMIISNQCDTDCSFVSGHTAIAIWSLSLALLAPLRFRKLAVACRYV